MKSQHSAAGKGSADRTTDDAAYRRNFDSIDWGHGYIIPILYERRVDDCAPDIVAARLARRRAWEGNYISRDKK